MLDLIFDTETTKFINWKLPLDHPDQPQLMQLGLRIVKADELVLEWDHFVVCTQDPAPGAFKKHGITREMTEEAGLRLVNVIEFFEQRLHDVERTVCHNSAFDIKVMLCAYAQANRILGEVRFDPTSFLQKPNICTMQSSTDLLKLAGKYPGQWKWPTLQEAYRALVDPEGFENAHSAAADCAATHGVLCALIERGVELKGAGQ